MVVSCPTCATRLRLDRQRLGGKRVTLRCARCRHAFKVEVPVLTAEKNAVENTHFHVLVAHSDKALCATISDILADAALSCQICHSGQETLDCMRALPPQVAVIDVALPGLFVFEMVDKIRKCPGLEQVKIILLSSIYNKTAYKRTPSSLYGADDYIEKHHIPDDLVTKINRLAVNAVPVSALGTSPAEIIPGQAFPDQESGYLIRDFVDTANDRIRSAEEGEISGQKPDDRVEKARRLARIIVSDIALYNQDRVEEGIRSGNFFQIMAPEVEEGKRLFSERIALEVSLKEDFLQQAFNSFIERRKIELRL